MKGDYPIYFVILLTLFLNIYLNIVKRVYILNSFFVFWSIIIAIFLLLFIQWKYINTTHCIEWLLVLELILLNFTLHGIFQFPHHFFTGNDAHLDFQTLVDLVQNGHITYGNSISRAGYWPIIHIFAALFSLVVTVNLYTIAKFFPILIDLSFPLILFISYKNISKNEKNPQYIAFFATLITIVLFNHIQFNSMFIRQTIAMIIIVIILLILSYEKRSFRLYLLLLLCVILVPFSHHFTSYIFLLILLILFSYESIIKGLYSPPWFVLFISFTVTLAFSVYINQSPIIIMTNFWDDIFLPSTTIYLNVFESNAFDSIRNLIILYGFIIFNAIFFIILLTYYKKIKLYYGYALILFACGLIGVILFIAPKLIFPDRLLSYGWIFGSVPLIILINKLPNPKRGFLFAVVFLYCLYNIFIIPPVFYCSSDDVVYQPKMEDYINLKSIEFTNLDNWYITTYPSHEVVIIDLYRVNSQMIINNKFSEYITIDRNYNDNYEESITNRFNKILDSKNNAVYMKKCD